MTRLIWKQWKFQLVDSALVRVGDISLQQPIWLERWSLNTYKVKIASLVLVVLDLPEMTEDDLIGAGEIPHGGGGQSSHGVIRRRPVGEVEAGAGVDRDGARVRIVLRRSRGGAVGHHHGRVAQRRCI